MGRKRTNFRVCEAIGCQEYTSTRRNKTCPEHGRLNQRPRTEPCDYAGCTRVRLTTNYCASHHYQFKAGQPLRDIEPRHKTGSLLCSLDFCQRVAKSKGFCNAHYLQNRKGQKLRPVTDRAKRGTWQNKRVRARVTAARRRARMADNGVFDVTHKDLNRLLASPCAVCGSTDDIHIDHIIPIDRGGRHSIGNLQPLCAFHNHSKNNRLMVEWMATRRAA